VIRERKKKGVPRAVLISHIEEGNSKVVGWKGAPRYIHNSRDVVLDNRWSVKEKELGLIQIKGCVRGFTKVGEENFEFNGFLSSRGVHSQGIIHKMVVRGSRL
jgi:hypothetical protein